MVAHRPYRGESELEFCQRLDPDDNHPTPAPDPDAEYDRMKQWEMEHPDEDTP